MNRKSIHQLILGLIALCMPASAVIGADATQPADAQRDPFYLQTSILKPEPYVYSILASELYRQGILIAARDGLGLQTRDESLREWRDAPPANVTWTFTPTDHNPFLSNGAGEQIWQAKQADGREWQWQVPEQTAVIEQLARNEFVALLKAKGFTGTGNVLKPGAAATDDAEDRLNELEELSQFAVLRQTHDLIRKDGESEARLGVLVRAYANLGQLTRFHWSIEHQVFAARSLLYAQRMVTNDPKSQVALWHRAYAMAMAGIQAQALKDLAAAKQLGDDAKAPKWVALLEPYCHYDSKKLTDLGTDNNMLAPLASYLNFLVIEHSGCQTASLAIEKAALANNPQCLRIIDAMCDITGPGLLNQLVEDGPHVFSATLGTEVTKMPGLPDAINQKIQQVRRPGGNPEGREQVCQAMIDQGSPENDPMEPSLAAVARSIQETTFAHVRQKASLIATGWGVDASDYVAQVQPLIADHRFRRVIDAYGAYHEATPDNAAAALKSLLWNDLTITEFPLYWLDQNYHSHGPGSSDRLALIFEGDMDASSGDLEPWFNIYAGALQGTRLKDEARLLQAASPDSPALILYNIANLWDKQKAAEWEKARGEYPSVCLALGKKYVKLRQYKDAERCLRQAIAASPDVVAYTALSDMYLLQGDENQWLETQKEYLAKTENVGLAHADVEVKIADYYVKAGKFAEAIAYADSAAGTGSAWGLECAANAHTAAADFKTAEEFVIEEFQHYDESPFKWILWCTQTGHGRKGDAYKAFHAYVATRGASLSKEDLFQLAIVSEVEQNSADAIAALNKRFDHDPGPLSLMHLLIFADESDDASAMDATIKRAAHLPNESTHNMSFAKELLKAEQPGGTLNLKAVDAILRKCDPVEKVECAELTARYLAKRGQKDAAITYVKKCYPLISKYCADHLLVMQTSRELGLDPTTGTPTSQPAQQP